MMRSGVLILLVTRLLSGQTAADCPKGSPYDLDDVVGLAKKLPNRERVKLVFKACGISFHMDSSSEQRLRNSGVTDEFINHLRTVPQPPATSVRKPGATQPASRFSLSVMLEFPELTVGSGKILDSGRFTAHDADKLAAQAAQWVRKTLDEHFPRTEKEIRVQAHVEPGTYRLSLEPPDPLRVSRFWMFTPDGEKTGHPPVEKSREAIEAALRNAKPGETGRVVIHLERPGYDLTWISFYPGTQPNPVVMAPLTTHPFTVIIRDANANQELMESLRAAMGALGLVVGGPELQKKKEQEYENSLKKNATYEQRLAHLRQARIDAFITVRLHHDPKTSAERSNTALDGTAPKQASTGNPQQINETVYTTALKLLKHLPPGSTLVIEVRTHDERSREQISMTLESAVLSRETRIRIVERKRLGRLPTNEENSLRVIAHDKLRRFGITHFLFCDVERRSMSLEKITGLIVAKSQW